MNMEPVKMTKEEKLEKVKELYKTANADQRYVLECLFSELRESDDEKIREAIEYAIGQSTHSDGTLINGVSSEKALAWVEEQVKHNNFRNKIQIGDKVTRNEDGVLVNLSQLERVAKPAEKQGEKTLANSAKISKDEQNPADTEKGAKGNVREIPNSAWSEEDDIMAHDIGYALRCQITYPKSRLSSMSSWIYGLKDRVQPQPRQEWSEEDEIIKTIKCALLFCCKGSLFNYELSYDGYEKCLSWLASLKPLSTWKPSEEQMKVLREVINFAADHATEHWSNYIFNVLRELRNQLNELNK